MSLSASNPDKRPDAWDEDAERDYFVAQDALLDSPDVISGCAAGDGRGQVPASRESQLEDVLRRIADPTYVGKCPDAEVVAIYREWARHVLEVAGPMPRRSKPRPDYDPRIDWPERYTDGPV